MSRLNVANFRHPDATADSVVITSGGDTQINRALGLGGATYGTSGQVLTSAGSGSAPTWGSAGKILQVKTTQYDTTTSISISDNNWTALPFYVEITPTSASSRFIVSYQSGGELGSGAHWNTPCGLGRANNSGSGFGSISWFEPASPGNRTPGLGIISLSYNSSDDSSTPEEIGVTNYVDDPNTTDTLRYYGGLTSDGNQTWYVNRTVTDSDSNGYERFRSWITVMEVAD